MSRTTDRSGNKPWPNYQKKVARCLRRLGIQAAARRQILDENQDDVSMWARQWNNGVSSKEGGVSPPWNYSPRSVAEKLS